ncbi:hypothetical protein QUB69_12845 [Microcoleus sp. AT13-A6]
MNNIGIYFSIILPYFVGRVRQPYITITNHLYKPALPPPITHVNLKFASHRPNVNDDCWLGGAGFLDCLFQAIMVGEPAPTGCMKDYLDCARVARNLVFGRYFITVAKNRKNAVSLVLNGRFSC